MYSSGGFAWIWFLWMGIIFVMFSSFGNWGYTYRVHRKKAGIARAPAPITNR